MLLSRRAPLPREADRSTVTNLVAVDDDLAVEAQQVKRRPGRLWRASRRPGRTGTKLSSEFADHQVLDVSRMAWAAAGELGRLESHPLIQGARTVICLEHP
jgi:hypothetical protein